MASSTHHILIVDDDELIAATYAAMLEDAGFQGPTVVTDSRTAMDVIRAHAFAAILLDLHMPHVSGTEILAQVTEEQPEVPVIILTLDDTVSVAVECMKLGAFDYMAKPVDQPRLVTSVTHAVQVRELKDEVRVLSHRRGEVTLSQPQVFASIVTRSDAMMQLFAYIEAIAASPRALLITGESGTGKELIARAVHDASGRSGQFVAVNVSGLDDTVFSDSLFGHRKGAFTGADSVRKGLIETAADGTLFLDEIGDLDNASQVKLLRLLQEDEYYPLGADQPQRSRARIVAATNADLRGNQGGGTFRRDLYYRLMAHQVHLPPLRDRAEDVEILIDYFVRDSYRSLGREPEELSGGVASAFTGYSFPGNVRELQAIVYDVVSRTVGRAPDLSDFAKHPSLMEQLDRTEPSRFSYTGSIPRLSDVEEFLFREALEKTGGNQSAAARLLGVSQSTLSRWISRGVDS